MNNSTANPRTADDNSKPEEEDLFISALKTLRVEHSLVLTENARLKAGLYDAQCEISNLKSELKETRALLGEAVVTANKKNSNPGQNQLTAVAVETTQKRARSPSIEIIEQPLPQKKAEGKQPSQSQAGVPVADTHQRSYPTPTPSSNDAKRRRIDPEQKSLSCSSSIKEPKLKHEDKVRVPKSMMGTYLSSSSSLPLPISPPPLLDLHVPRRFLRVTYGGSDQHFLQYTKEDPQRNIVFPMLDMNPAMPVQPGHAGLVFASRHEILSDGPWTLFCKPPETGKALWLYLGEYTNVLCGKMSKEEFGIQRDVVKREWAKMLLRMKQFDVYVSMRARIALRKVGVLPVADANEAERLVKAEMDKIKTSKGTDDIIRMTCVKYDHAFADDMKTQFAKYQSGEDEDRVPPDGKARRGFMMMTAGSSIE